MMDWIWSVYAAQLQSISNYHRLTRWRRKGIVYTIQFIGNVQSSEML